MLSGWPRWSAFMPAVLNSASSLRIYNLSEVLWTAGNAGLDISVPGHLPSQIHLDLFEAKVIGDPYYGLNDFNLRWVALHNWTYTATLPLTYDESTTTFLLFNGLDTYTTIELCGQHVANTDNQFRQYHFDVSHILRECKKSATLTLNFGSVPNIINAIATQPDQEKWPCNGSIEGVFEFPNRQFVRKEQSDFGWDWGPAFVPVGPWQPAYALQLSRSDVYVRNTLIDIYRRGQRPLIPPDQSQPWVLNVSLDVIGDLPAAASLSYLISDSSGSAVLSGPLDNVTVTNSTISGSALIPSDKVELWWPVGLGRQVLYDLTISLADGAADATSVNKRVGFRTIVLNQEQIRRDQLEKGIAPGNNWHFEINGLEFYAKGSNFIPPDAFWPRVDDTRIRNLFNAVIEGNQNMLRIWSSGAYSPDFLYDIADELGILLWSEFEFGDALYPVDKPFLDNVREEVTYQVRRVNHHPSLALWAGGNELENLELAMVKRCAPDQFPRLLAEYETLFLDTIVPCVFENSHSISYTPTSSGNGWQSLDFSKVQPITERYYNTTPGSVYGNTDYYNYDTAFAFNTSAYPTGRFSNEFGFHSMPSRQSWQAALDPADMWFNSSTIQLRNHHYPSGGLNTTNFANSSKGMAEMTLGAQQWYPVPNKTNAVANFTSWCHITQIFQADFYKSQIMFYRRGSGKPERQLGSLYWQLEDIWAAPTWAGIEYDGRWKVLHYTAKDIYKNVIITPFSNTTTGDLEVYVTSDLWSPVTGTASFTWYDWAGNLLNISTPSSVPITVGAINTTLAFKTNLNDVLPSATVDPREAVLHMSVSVNGSLPNDPTPRTFQHENWFHPTPLSQARLVDPKIQFRYYGNALSVRSSATAAWVWIDYPEGSVVQFSENGFWLRKGEERQITWKTISGRTDEKWAQGLTVESIWDMKVP